MYCQHCGSEITVNAKFCASCGRAVNPLAQSEKVDDEQGSAKPAITRALSIFVPTFLVVLVVNQLFYGGCFKAYCLAAAFPKIAIVSAVIAWVIYAISGQEESKN